MVKRKKFDLSAPNTQQLRDEIVHGAFTTEGTMVAFPLCFPGASVPIPADESRVTALTVNRDGVIYGGTSGRRAHLFGGIFHGVTGVVFDMGVVDGANQCAAVCCGKNQVVGCVNGPAGGWIVRRPFEPLPFDLLQEWGFERKPLERLAGPANGERIVHAVADEGTGLCVIATNRHLARLTVATGETGVVGRIPGQGRVAFGSGGRVVGMDDRASLWAYDPASDTLEHRAYSLPEGDWEGAFLTWARDPVDGTLYAADGAGRLFSFREDQGFSECLGQVPLAPVKAMAVTFDGRLFGSCGEGMAKNFRYCPASGALELIGVAVSVLERRRYGYVFADAATGRDGQIIFGEDDNLGHLWLYYPRIGKSRPSRPPSE